MSVLPIGFGSEEGGYRIERSLRFNSSDSAFLNRTPASAGNRKTWTWSGWVKRSDISGNAQVLFGATDGTNQTIIYAGDGTNPTFRVNFQANGDVITTAVYRDPSAWYHIVVALDTTQATSSNRVKLYINGTQVTAFGTADYPSQNLDAAINGTFAHSIGGRSWTSSQYVDGYLTEINFIDGQALTPSSFGETDTDTGVWKPKKYTGSYGTNGFYLNFSDNSGVTSTTLGADSSGNGNNWTPNNFSVTAGAGNDSLVDTPTPYGTDTGVGGEVRGNYATGSPVATTSNNITWANGNLDLQIGTSGEWRTSVIPFDMPSSKWYWEVTLLATVNDGDLMLGVINSDIATQSISGNSEAGSQAYGYIYYSGGLKINNGSNSAYGATWSTSGDVIGVAFDASTGELTFYKNGSSQGLAYTVSSSKKYIPVISGTQSGGTKPNVAWNFGQRPFAYTAPSGFKALCTQNLPEPTIVDGGEYFNTVLYSGNGTSQTIDTGLQPDFIWIKRRNGAAAHTLTDSVRGTSKQLFSNLTDAEQTDADSGVTAIGSSSMTLGDNNLATGSVNGSGSTYVAWNWKANGSGVSNTDGTITSTVSANTDSGFSIVTYTHNGTNAATVGHGLGVTPSFIINKQRSASSNWRCYHVSLTAGYNIQLNLTQAQGVAGDIFQTAPTSSVFTPGNGDSASGQTFVAYCFAAIPGYSAFGSYTGNGSADGPFVFTNFRPAFVMIKRTDSAGSWEIYDNNRIGYNVDNNTLFADLSNAESTADRVDILSNGFKLKSTAGDNNASGGTYIYMAFAEVPVKFSLAR